ncbi:hypothetical protein MTO96_046410 [Rhipicephalus appendiculatus]
MAATTDLPARENSFMFTAPEGDVSIDDLIDAIERSAGDDSVLVLQHMGGAKFLVCTRNASQATRLMTAEGFRINGESVPVEAVGPPVTYVNVYRYPAYLSDETLGNALAQYGKVKGITFATVATRQNKLNGVRVVKIEMSKPVPNFATIAGHRVMFEYRGMRRASPKTASRRTAKEPTPSDRETDSDPLTGSGEPSASPFEKEQHGTEEDGATSSTETESSDFESTVSYQSTPPTSPALQLSRVDHQNPPDVTTEAEAPPGRKEAPPPAQKTPVTPPAPAPTQQPGAGPRDPSRDDWPIVSRGYYALP